MRVWGKYGLIMLSKNLAKAYSKNLAKAYNLAKA